MKLSLVVGTRPQVIKSVPIIHEARRRRLNLEIIHTGQHYDDLMSDVFFRTFSIPRPAVNLGVGSGSNLYQTGEIILRLGKVLSDMAPDLLVVPGDTNSALAAALASAKARIPLAHVEAGARCYDMAMQEEINRRIIDHVSNFLFPVSRKSDENLARESVMGKHIVSGDTMYEVFKSSRDKIAENKGAATIGVKGNDYAVLTLHRPENVDSPQRVTRIVREVASLGARVVFPLHPRTRRRLNLREIEVKTRGHITTIEPLDYYSMMNLVGNSKMVITDSGGLQKEAFWSGVPCVTLRRSTEWTELVDAKVNFLVPELSMIKSTLHYVVRNCDRMKRAIQKLPNPYDFGGASRIILESISTQKAQRSI